MDVCSNVHERDWAYLLPEAIDAIVEKLDDSFSAFLSFISVCQHWRLVALEGKESKKRKKKKKDDNTQKLEILRTCRNHLPLLILEKSIHRDKVARCFLSCVPSYEDAVCYRLQKHRDLPGDRSYFGSSFGWLLAQGTPELEIVLFNPFTCVVLCLPLLPLDRHTIGARNKGVLSSDPCKKGAFGSYEVVIIIRDGFGLARYRSRTKSWTIMCVELVGTCYLVDVVFYQGKIYVSTDTGDLLEADFDTGTTRFVVTSYPRNRLSCVTHLVVSKLGGDLLMVKQINGREFKVFKLCYEEEVWKWVEINDLGDQTLIVGSTGGTMSRFSTCVSTLEFPKCRANCVYYTCSVLSSPGREARGVFRLELKQDLEIPCHDVGGGADGVGCATSSHVQNWIVPS